MAFIIITTTFIHKYLYINYVLINKKNKYLYTNNKKRKQLNSLCVLMKTQDTTHGTILLRTILFVSFLFFFIYFLQRS